MQSKVLILDFGSQVTKLIARNIRELNVYCEIIPYNSSLEKIKSISREKLTELRNLFNEELIDKDEYDDLRKNLIEIE